MSKNKKDYSNAFSGIRCLIFYVESKGERNAEIDDFFEKFLGSIKYLDVEYAKTIWIELKSLILQNYFMDIKVQKYISFSIGKCIELYRELAAKGQRFYMDGLYNCVDALHGYYDSITNSQKEVSKELADCVAEVKTIDNFEIRNIWNG